MNACRVQKNLTERHVFGFAKDLLEKVLLEEATIK
jgi:hypothetical protein